MICKTQGCNEPAAHEHSLCVRCIYPEGLYLNKVNKQSPTKSLSDTYPKYFKSIKGINEIDVYGVCKLFPVDDPSGAINHARKKLLVPGVRTGGKSMYKDIKEARDTLTRWLELNPEN